MVRALVAVTLAFGAGAALTYQLVAPRSVAPVVTANAEPDALERGGKATTETRGGVAEHAQLLRTAAQANASTLDRWLTNAAAERPSTERTFTLGVLFSRYGELDHERAIATARRFEVDTNILASLYAQWAAEDPADALDALSRVEDPVEATAIGLAMLDTLGSSDYAVRQVSAALPDGAERAFRVGAVAALATQDPAAALDQAVALADSGLSGLALQRLAMFWAREDVNAALAAGDTIDDQGLRSTFQSAVLREWAQFDLDGVFEYVLRLDTVSQERLAALGGLREVAALDPLRTLDLSAQLPASLRAGLTQAALQSLAQRDPARAVQEIGRLPQGQQQQFFRQQLASAYGKKDPEAALAWARSTGMRENLFGVLAGVAVNDAKRAFDILQTLPAADRRQAVQTVVQNAMNDRGADLRSLANGLVALEDVEAGQASMEWLMNAWAGRAQSDALDWVMTSGERVPPAAFVGLARHIGQRDPVAAEQYLTQVPKEARSAWIQGFAQGSSQADPRAAAVWLERYRSEAAYPGAAGIVAQALARIDAPAAAQLLDNIEITNESDPMALSSAAHGVATAWARTDPTAAADWARRFATEESGQMALRGATEIWASNDYAAARSWTLRLPSGTIRDAALGPLLAVERSDGPDPLVVQAFSAEPARQTAMLGAVYRVARRDPADARALIERHITLPEQRKQAERAVDDIERRQQLGSASAVFFSN